MNVEISDENYKEILKNKAMVWQSIAKADFEASQVCLNSGDNKSFYIYQRGAKFAYERARAYIHEIQKS